MKKSVILAFVIAGIVSLWVLSGELSGSDTTGGTDSAGADQRVSELFTVKVRDSQAEAFTQTILIRGRTEALRAVELKSETDGRVVETPVDDGQRVTEGSLICRIATDQREADLAKAKALAEQRRLEYEGALELAQKGHRSEQQVAAAKAQLDAALADVRGMEVELAHTRIEAPFPGIIDDRSADVGDYLQKGGVCARIIQEEPFLVVGEVSEQKVGQIVVGTPATVRIITGDERRGTIRFISNTANLATRTFRVEVVLPNTDHGLREGLSAEIRVPVRQSMAHYIRPSTLVLDSQGRVGIRGVENGVVVFYPIEILDDAIDGIWISGPPDQAELITVGQEFVSDGQKVETVQENARIGS